MTRVATYARVAAPARAGRRQLERQEARLARAVVSWRACAHIAAYADIGPASSPWRPGLARLVADASSGCFDVVAVEGLDWLAMNPSDLRLLLAELEAFGVGVHAVGRPLRRRALALATAAAGVQLADLVVGRW